MKQRLVCDGWAHAWRYSTDRTIRICASCHRSQWIVENKWEDLEQGRLWEVAEKPTLLMWKAKTKGEENNG